MRIWLLILVAVLQLAAAPVATPQSEPVHHISMAALLANPERFDGQLVEVTGFLNLEFEGDSLYLGKADHEAFILKNAVWIDGPSLDEDRRIRDALSHHYASVAGRFDAGSHGHLGQYIGTVEASSIYRTATRRDLLLMTRYDPYTVHLPVDVDIPWPAILTGLYLAILGAGMAVLRNMRRSGLGSMTAPWALPFAIGFGLFSLIRIIGAASALWLDARYRVAGDFTLLHASELAIGLVGLAAMMAFWRRRSWLPVLAACMVQLAVPTIIEAVRFDGIFPLNNGRAWSGNVSWTRDDSRAVTAQ